MFDEPGEKIKITAKVLFWLSMIGSLGLGIVFGRDRYGDVEFLRFLLIFVSGAVVSFVSSLVLYGFGEAVESVSGNNGNAYRIHRDLDEIKRKLDRADESVTAQGKEKPQTGSFNLADYIY